MARAVGPANALCALVVLVGGLLLCVQAMLVVFRALLAQYEHFAMPAEEAAFSLYEFRFAGALMLAGARMLLPWRWAQALCEAALAAILLYCAVSRLKGADWRAVAPAVGGALAALSAAAGLAVLVGRVCRLFLVFEHGHRGAGLWSGQSFRTRWAPCRQRGDDPRRHKRRFSAARGSAYFLRRRDTPSCKPRARATSASVPSPWARRSSTPCSAPTWSSAAPSPATATA